mmetsp:Transcript_2273/g.2390  ORF Transcript_2273/g.2390 Transcript_2273/m.2390 type:complete len:98 (+) Transcript_2273:441-734(+)
MLLDTKLEVDGEGGVVDGTRVLRRRVVLVSVVVKDDDWAAAFFFRRSLFAITAVNVTFAVDGDDKIITKKGRRERGGEPFYYVPITNKAGQRVFVAK